MTIKGKRTSVVLISSEDWEAIQETLYLLSIPGMGDSVIKGIKTTIDQCDEDLDW